ncbi:MAG TPA: hypothetical protein VGL57_06705 [Solirubrobacteraceae bacterium]|jgi:hypothetical protein
MSLRTSIAVLGAVLLALPGTASAQSSTPSTAPSVAQESGNPINDQGSSYNYRSYVTSVVPHVPGLSLEVLEFADRLLLTNHSGRTVTVYGYQEEPYARVLADGLVQLNTRSPAYYLNQNFYGQVTVPSSASPAAPPHWVTVDRTGQLEWHDHRIHWMSPIPPAKVKNKNKRTLIFQWQVPIQVGVHKGTVNGNLFWVPLGNSSAPVGAILALVAFVVLGLLAALFVRKRRAGRPPRGGSGPSHGADRDSPGGAPVQEAW